MNQYQPLPERPYGYPPPQYYEQLRRKRPLRRWATIIGLGLILCFVIQIILGSVWGEVAYAISFYDLDPALLSLIEESAFLFIYISALWPSTLFIMAWIKIPQEVAFPVKKPRFLITVPGLFVLLGASILGSYLSGLLGALMESVLGMYPVPPDFSPPEGLAANIVYVVSITLAPAFFEESMFRGVILQSLRRFGDGFALVTSAVLFSLMHGNLTQAPAAFIGGLLMGYFVLRTGSIVPGMVFHFANNSLAVIETYLDGFLSGSQYEIISLSIFAGSILLGLAALVFLALRVGGMFRLAPAKYPLTAAKKVSAFFLSPAEVVFIVIVAVMTLLQLAPV